MSNMASTNQQAIHFGCQNQEAFEDLYQVIKCLGKGGYGEVYEAKKLSNGRKVAVKEVLRSSVKSWAEVRSIEYFCVFHL